MSDFTRKIIERVPKKGGAILSFHAFEEGWSTASIPPCEAHIEVRRVAAGTMSDPAGSPAEAVEFRTRAELDGFLDQLGEALAAKAGLV